MQKPLAAGSQDSRSLLTQFLRKWNLWHNRVTE
jgi:hypothetical protein